MPRFLKNPKLSFSSKLLALFTILAFCSSSIILPPKAQAQNALHLPQPGIMVSRSPQFVPTYLKGMTINQRNPFQLDFIIDNGHSKLKGNPLKQEADKLIHYFLASLTIPEEDLWVNLSPYEKDRIIPEEFGTTAMGRDLLAQDYLLKQLTASLIYPEKDLGKAFWNNVHSLANDLYGNSEIPINTFNKVWVIPEKVIVHEFENTVIILDSHLKVMLEKDYLATSENLEINSLENNTNTLNNDSSDIVRDLIIPEIEKEINQGKNFAPLRQIYHSMILATWYKKKLQDSPLNKTYSDQKKVEGIDSNNKKINRQIYDKYVQAFNVGVYDFIKEDYDEKTQKNILRKYFSGGVRLINPGITQSRERNPKGIGTLGIYRTELRPLKKQTAGSPVAVFKLLFKNNKALTRTEITENILTDKNFHVNTIGRYLNILYELGLIEKTKIGTTIKNSLIAEAYEHAKEIIPILENLTHSNSDEDKIFETQKLILRIIGNSKKTKEPNKLHINTIDYFEDTKVKMVLATSNEEISEWEKKYSELEKKFGHLSLYLFLENAQTEFDETFKQLLEAQIGPLSQYGNNNDLPNDYYLINDTYRATFLIKILESIHKNISQWSEILQTDDIHRRSNDSITFRPLTLWDSTEHTLKEKFELSLDAMSLPKNIMYIFLNLMSAFAKSSTQKRNEFLSQINTLRQDIHQAVTWNLMNTYPEVIAFEAHRGLTKGIYSEDNLVLSDPAHFAFGMEWAKTYAEQGEQGQTITILAPIESILEYFYEDLNIDGFGKEPVLIVKNGTYKAQITGSSPMNDVGGINMNSKWLNIDTQNEGDEIIFDINPEQFQNLDIQGLKPFIFDVTPIPNLSPFLRITKYEKN